MEDGCDVFILEHSHQDPSSTVLHWSLWMLLLGVPIKCVAVIQPGGDKGVDELLGVKKGE